MRATEVRAAVEKFQREYACGEKVENCFAPWYLHQVFHLPPEQAIEQSSNGNYDFGIDGFHFERSSDYATLVLVQAKLSSSLREVVSGFHDMGKSLPELSKALENTETDIGIENKVLVNLRAALRPSKMPTKEKKSLHFDFVVIHLCEEDPTIIGNRVEPARTKLKEGMAKFLESRICTIKDKGPHDMGERQEIIIPQRPTSLSLSHLTEPTVVPLGTMSMGLGKLSELVDLYQARRDDLFSKNVRQFLRGARQRDRGPAGRMRETLKAICISRDSRLSPETFALYHNGVTLLSGKVKYQDGNFVVYEPYVLNGCQTIKNAFYFKNDPNLRDKITGELWDRVLVPLKIISTEDKDFIRAITVSNNRQNAIRPSALRANDDVQIGLQQRFARINIFYQRQEDAYKNLEASDPEQIEEAFADSRGSYVWIEDLARAICAAAGEIRLAEHPQEIFESDSAYEKCFGPKPNPEKLQDGYKRLRSILFLVFLQNLHDVIRVVLKKDLGLERQNPKGPAPSRLTYFAMCLLLRHLAKYKEIDAVFDYSTALYGKDAYFRDRVRRWLSTQSSGITRELRERLLTLESADAKSLHAAFERTEHVLRLTRDYDPFETFSALDDKLDKGAAS